MNTNNNLLFLVHLPPPIHGVSIINEEIRQHFSAKYPENTLFLNIATSGKTEYLGKLHFKKKLISYLKLFYSLHKLLRSHCIRKCYFTFTPVGPAIYKDYILYLLLRIYKTKALVHLHSKGVIKEKNNLLKRVIYMDVFRNSDLIVLSPRLLSDLDGFRLKSVRYCPNGLLTKSPENFKYPKKEKLRILYLSNLIKNKGIEDLLRAVSLLRNESIELVFVGGMVDVNQAWFDNRVNRYGIENITFYLGPKYGLAKEAIYESSDIFVLPTHHDCFPLVIIEAMSHGLPIISTKVGAIPDILIDEFDSYLIDPGDHMELFRKLRQLVTNPDLRRKFGKRAFSRYEKNFTKEQFLLRLDKTVTDWVDESV